MTPATMLIAFDGSEESRRALEYAARLLTPRRVEVLTAGETVNVVLTRSGARTLGLHVGLDVVLVPEPGAARSSVVPPRTEVAPVGV